MKGMIKIAIERCKGCAYCAEACPADVISMSNHFNKSGFFPAVAEHPEKCTGCAICANMCPEVAIEVYRDNHKNKKYRFAR
jgi:2-oxoglutarate ferredoxin oxidoreductase subunit delta